MLADYIANSTGCVEQPSADQTPWEKCLMLEDYPNTIQQMKHEEEKSAVSLKTVESATEAKATGEAKVATKTAVVEKAVVKKDKTTNGAVQALPQVSKTTRFNSPVYGKCKIDAAEKRSYVQW